MEITTYKDLEWYIIKETDKEKLLFLRECLTNKQIIRYFTEKEMVDEFFDVKFNSKLNPWWDESYIGKVLNSAFLSDLDKNDLNKMKITLELNGKTRVVEDYVRLLTKEEAESLPPKILKTERKWGYWTMSPFQANSSSDAFVCIVGGSNNPCYSGYVNISRAVRPVISLKPNILKSSTETQNSSIITNIPNKDELIKKLTLGSKILNGIK